MSVIEELKSYIQDLRKVNCDINYNYLNDVYYDLLGIEGDNKILKCIAQIEEVIKTLEEVTK